MKKKFALIFIAVMGLSLMACGDKTKPAETVKQDTQKQTTEAQPTEAQTTEAQPIEPQSTEVQSTMLTETDPTATSPAEKETKPTAKNSEVAKINGGADKVGIYSIVVRLTDKAADKGTVEMVYHGAKGSPQENSVVNTFRIEYYKEDAGTFEIKTFFNGEAYQNQHHKEEVKVTNTFDATLRAGKVNISYTPEGGETQEIFSADADYFRSSEDK